MVVHCKTEMMLAKCGVRHLPPMAIVLVYMVVMSNCRFAVPVNWNWHDLISNTDATTTAKTEVVVDPTEDAKPTQPAITETLLPEATLYISETTLFPTDSTTTSATLIRQQQGINAGIYCPVFVSGENYTFVSELYTLTSNSDGLLPAVSVFVDSQSDTGQVISVVEYRCEATTEAGDDVQSCSSNKFDPNIDAEVSRLIPADSAQDFIYKLRVTFPAVQDFLEYINDTLGVMWEVDGIQYDTPLNCTVSNTSSQDLCSGNPCLNRGQCVDISDGYICQCIPGYFGHQCGAVYRRFTCRYKTGVVSFQQTGSSDCKSFSIDCYDPGSTDPLQLTVMEQTVTPTTGVNQPTVTSAVSTTDPNAVHLRVCNIENVAVGNYQYEFKISNLNKEGDVSDFNLTVKVEDTPPKFNANIYRILVAQRVQENQVIVPVNISKSMVCTQNLSCIQIIHPDSGRINLSISLIDDTDGVQNIQFAQKQEETVSLGYFYLERDGFDGSETYVLTANVGPYSASATAVFTANKLCMPSRFNITIEDSFTTGHVLENLHCVDDTSGPLVLTLEGTHKDLFSISADSSGYWLTMVNDFSMSMPRDIPLTVYAKDGIDEMRYYFTVQLALLGCQVRNQSYPDDWSVGTTFTVFLECYNDVGSAGVEGENFEVIGVIPLDENSLVEVTLELTGYMYGNIDMNLTLFSSDGLIQQDMVLEIPVWNKISFTQDNYVTEILDYAEVGSSVVTVWADASTVLNSIVFTLEGDPADQIFAVDSQSGTVSTIANLTSYQWQRIRFQIEARDGVVGRPFTTNVEVFVVGTGPNQVDCNWESQENIVLQWNTPSGHIVNRLTCTDLTGPDLIFSIVHGDSLVQVSGDGTVKLIATLTSTDAEAIQQVDILVENDRKTGIYSLFITVQAFKYPFQAMTLDEFTIGDTWVSFPFKQNQSFILEASERGWVEDLRIDCDGFFYPIFQYRSFNPIIVFSNAQVIIRNIASQLTYSNCAMVWSFSGTVTDVSSRITFTTRNTISAQITPTPPVKYVMLDQSLSLSCELVERDEEICCPSLHPNFYWLQQNGRRIYRGKEVQIMLESEDDFGNYTCYAELEFLNYTQTLSVRRAAAVFEANYLLSTNIDWVPELADNTSIPYTILKYSLTRRINKLLEARPNYNGCEIVQFRLEEPRDVTMSSGHDMVLTKRRSTGIVLADVTTSELVGNVADTTDIVSQLDQLVKSDNLTKPNDPEDIVLPHNISMTPSILLEKGSQSITALFLVFLPNSKSLGVSPRDNVIWTQDESERFPTSSYDVEVNSVTVPQDFLIRTTTSVYLLNTTLYITDMTQDDIGVYNCTINMPHHGIAAVSQIIDLTSRRFIKAARIRIDPPTQTVVGPNSIVFIQVYYANAERITCTDVETGQVNSTTVVLSDQEENRDLSFTVREDRQIDCVAEAERIGDLRGVNAFDETIIKVANSVTELCPEVIERNITWAVGRVGSESRARCPPEYAEGLASRICLEGAEWGTVNTSMCVKKTLVDLDQQISNILSGLDNETALETVGSRIAQALNGSQITSGDIRQTVNTLVRVSMMAEDIEREPVSPETVKEFSLAADELLKADNDDWENAQQQDGKVEQARLLVALDKMAESSLRSDRLLPEPLITETLAIKQGIVSQDGINFPQESEQLEQSWVKNSGSQVRLDKNAFPPNKSAKYSITVYRGEEDKFPTSKALQEKHSKGQHLAGKQLNSDLISITVYPKPTSILAKPLELTYKVLDSENFTEPDCAFLDTDTGELGLWSSTGCTKEHGIDGSVRCRCTHLTNFAILMSPAGKPANVGPFWPSPVALLDNKLCMPSRFNITIEDSFTAGHVLENLHCVDDISGPLALTLEGTHKDLFSISADSSGYWLTMVNDFNMSMPRDIPLTVYAKDGIDEMRYYFTVQLALLGCQVRNQSYPDDWSVGTTFTVFLECYNDVGSAGVEGETFEVIGVIPLDENSLVEVTLELTGYTYGNIDMNLTLFSSDGLIQQDMVLEIPVWNKISFTQDNYVTEILDYAEVGSSVVTVWADASTVLNSIVFTLEGDPADQIFAVDSQSGTVSTIANLTSYQWQRIRFQIEARDGADGRPFTTNVEVFVVGTGPNQVNCNWESSEDIVLQWNTPSGHIVNRLTCTDLTEPDLIFSAVHEDSLVQVSGDGTVKLIATVTSTDAEAIQQVDILVENDRKTAIYSLFITVQAFKYPFQAMTLDEFSIGDTWVYFPFKQNQSFILEASERGWVEDLRIDCDGFFYTIFQYRSFNPLIVFSNAQVIIRNIASQLTYSNCAMVWSFNGTATDVSSRITFTTRNTISAQITPTPPVKYVMLDQSLSLSCELVERYEEICCPSLHPNFYWLQQNEKRIYRGKEVQIVLESEDDFGNYTCYAELEFLNYTQTLSVDRAAAVFKANYTLSTNIDWVPELADNTSIPYTVLKYSLTRRINKLLEARPNYNGCEIVQFRLEEPRDVTMSSGHDMVLSKRRSTGIVLADVTTSELVGNVVDTTDIVSQLDQLVKSDNLTRPNDPEDIVLPHNISMTPSILLEKGSQSITALFLVFLPNSESLVVSPRDNVIWTQDESERFPTSSYDVEINSVTVPQDFLIRTTTSVYLLNTTLYITDMTQDDIGVYNCTINMPHHGIGAVSQIIDLTSRRFIKAARIRIDPPTQTVVGPSSIVFIQVYYANAERITCTELETGQVNSTTVVLSDQEEYRDLSFTVREDRQIDCVAEAERIGDLRGVNAFDETIIKVANSVTELCPEVIERNITWAVGRVGSESRARCPPEYAEGLASRICLEGAEWGTVNTSMCVKKTLVDLDQQISNILSGLDNETALETVGSRIAQALNGSQITSGDIRQTVNTLVRVSMMAEDIEREPVSPETVKEFSLAADELLKADNDDWENAQQQDGKVEQARLLVALDKMAESSLRSDRLLPEPLITETLAIKQGIVSQDGINFPEESEQLEQSWVKNSGSQVRLDKNAFPSNKSAKYSITVYRGEEDKFPTSKALQEKHSKGQHLAGKQLNSDLISITVYPKPTSILAKPVELTYKVLDSENFTEPDCAFLDTDTGELGLWSSTGCTKEHGIDGSVLCRCTHLTNFAILMSPAGKPTSAHHEALSIITMVGCVISILCLILKLLVYFVLWKFVKHDRSVLHVNLAVCLIIGYVTFLAGVDKTENEIACTIVAALLHFVFLAAFCIMLANGVEILISVTFVFEKKSLLYKLLLISYGIPLVVVALTLGITKTEGYRSEDFCWLSVDSGVLWSFVGPALGVILVNYIIIIIVVRTMLHTATMMTKQARAKTKSILKAIGVLCPIMGLTWVLGVFAVNDDLLFFQYCFAVVNSLQGVFIFIFHVLLCHQVKDGYRVRKRRYQAKSFDSGTRMTTTSEFHSTTRRGSTDSQSVAGFQNQSFQHDLSSPSSSGSSQTPLSLGNVQEEPIADNPSSQHINETLDNNAGSDTQGSVSSGSVTQAYDKHGHVSFDIADNPGNEMSGNDVPGNLTSHNEGSGFEAGIQEPPPTLNPQADEHTPHWKKTAKDRWHKVQQWARSHVQNKWPRGNQTVMSDNMGYTAGPTRPNDLFKQSSREDVM